MKFLAFYDQSSTRCSVSGRNLLFCFRGTDDISAFCEGKWTISICLAGVFSCWGGERKNEDGFSEKKHETNRLEQSSKVSPATLWSLGQRSCQARFLKSRRAGPGGAELLRLDLPPCRSLGLVCHANGKAEWILTLSFSSLVVWIPEAPVEVVSTATLSNIHPPPHPPVRKTKL